MRQTMPARSEVDVKAEDQRLSPADQELDIKYKLSKLENYRNIVRASGGDIYKPLAFGYAAGLLSLAAVVSAANVKGGGVASLVSDENLWRFKIVSNSAVVITAIGLILSMIGFYYTFRYAEYKRNELAREIEKKIYGEEITEQVKEEFLIKIPKGVFKFVGKASAAVFLIVILLETTMILMMVWR